MLETNHVGRCGLHYAIRRKQVDMIRHLLENVYFPNNDKQNKNGVAFMNMRAGGSASLTLFVLVTLVNADKVNSKRDLEILKLLLSYGMKFDAKDPRLLVTVVKNHRVDLLAFIFDQDLIPINIFDHILQFMYEFNALQHGVDTEILKELYNYGLVHGVICTKHHHEEIVIKASEYDLAVFKATMSIILTKQGVNDLKQYKQCYSVDWTALETILESPNTKQDVKWFIKALISGDDTKSLKLDGDTSNQAVLTCINNHELQNNNDKKIFNYKKMCPFCGDNMDGLQSLCGFECVECKSFICDDCIIVQKISKKIDDNGDNEYALRGVVKEIFECKNNKKLFNKVELRSRKFLFTLL